MKAFKWTKEEIVFLKANFSRLTHQQIAENLGRSAVAVKTFALKRGFKKDRFRFSPEQLEILRSEYPTTAAKELAEKFGCTLAAVHRKAHQLGLKKDPEWIRAVARELSSRPDHGGRKNHFQSGHTPHNKGQKGVCAPGCEKGWFKKGHLPVNHKPVGHQRVTKDGYIEIKVAEPNRFRLLHRLVWEKYHGKVPENHVVTFRDRNPQNCAIENLELITRSEHAVRNRQNFLNALAPEMREAHFALIRLKREINKQNAKKSNSGLA